MLKLQCKTIGFLSFGSLIVLLFSPYHALLPSVLNADDASYLAHAFSLGLDFNFDYHNTVADWFGPSGRVPAHPVGPGLLAAPFVALFSLLDWLRDSPVLRDHLNFQYSWSYFGFVFASSFYFLFGIRLYIVALERWFQVQARAIYTLFALSSGVAFYVFFRPIMGHAFEFFSLALVFWGSCKLSESLFSDNPIIHYADAFACFFGVILTILIRPAVLNVILIPVIVGLSYQQNKRINRTWLAKDIIKCGKPLLVAFVIVLLIFMKINVSLYGVYFPSSQEIYGNVITSFIPQISTFYDLMMLVLEFIKRLPKIVTIVFSSEFGLLYTSPILILGLVLYGVVVYKNFREGSKLNLILAFLILAYVALPLAIVLFWQSPADAFGYRFLFSWFPVALFGYALWQNRLSQHHTLWFQSVRGFIIGLSIFSLMSTLFFGINEDLKYHANQLNSFGIEWSSAVGYNIAVAKAMVSPNAWFNLLVGHSPGFFMVALIKASNIDFAHFSFSNQFGKFEQFLCCYQFPSWYVYLQAFMIITLSLCFLWWVFYAAPLQRKSGP